MRLLTTTLAALISLAASVHAETLVGVAAPLSGPSAILGKQIEAGTGLAAEAQGLPIKTVD
ncbi:ABC transporter substrate-binding protein, partial [Mesorhizobium sp. M1E.F.Ca.ET.063.01.1.1]